MANQAHPAMEHDLEKRVIIGKEIKKNLRGKMKIQYLERMATLQQQGIEECWTLHFYHQRLPKGNPTGHNENFKLEHLWFGESANNSKTLAYDEEI